uniref:glutaminase n=1 Tax=Heterorhabditis bacteriophora TaxID=37862 RepID=A0A1I7WV47_HETBA
MDQIKNIEDLRENDDNRGLDMKRQMFKDCIQPSVQLISQALRNQMIIPSWGEFCSRIKEIFDECRDVTGGEVATYIPQLARQDPTLWGMSICTIDGQRVSYGDFKRNFCIQSVSKAFNYSIVASDLGAETVHSYVGHEPSGRLFNEICLDGSGKSKFFLTILIMTNLYLIWMAYSFDYRFLSERDSADRNYALSYYMKENNCFPSGTKSLREELDLYFQLCSLETNCDTLAVMAATLANGGVCPLTDERCVAPQPCRDVLSLMYSCAKSGVSGVMIVVVPNLMGIALFSPPLDKMGNSTRGVAFCRVRNRFEKLYKNKGIELSSVLYLF